MTIQMQGRERKEGRAAVPGSETRAKRTAEEKRNHCATSLLITIIEAVSTITFLVHFYTISILSISC